MVKKNNIVMLTAYDFGMAKILDESGVDIILVGDSLGNVVLGYENTLPVTVEDMIHHTKAVRRGIKKALLISDMPKKAFSNPISNAKKIMKEGGAQGLKIEGVRYLNIIKKLVKMKIPVMGHIGFTPQYIKEIGGYKIQGKSQNEKLKMIKEAKMLEDAGVFAIVIELTTEETAKEITAAVKIPTIGIGAGRFCNGQVVVTNDMLGLYEGHVPKFVKKYADLAPVIRAAVANFIKDVRIAPVAQ